MISTKFSFRVTKTLHSNKDAAVGGAAAGLGSQAVEALGRGAALRHDQLQGFGCSGER